MRREEVCRSTLRQWRIAGNPTNRYVLQPEWTVRVRTGYLLDRSLANMHTLARIGKPGAGGERPVLKTGICLGARNELADQVLLRRHLPSTARIGFVLGGKGCLLGELVGYPLRHRQVVQ